MPEIGLLAIPVDVDYTTFGDLRIGRATQQVLGRLLRFWEASPNNRDNDYSGIDFLLLDEKNSVIQCSIPAAIANEFRPRLQKGHILAIRGFEVQRRPNLYVISDHHIVIQFIPNTSIVNLPDAVTRIKQEKFRIRKVDHLEAIANTNRELSDIVGQIKYVQGLALDDTTSQQRVLILFRIDASVHVYLSLWNAAAARFRAHLSYRPTLKSVMVVTAVNPKMVKGRLYLNSTPATMLLFDSTVHAIHQFTARLGIPATEPFKQAETKNSVRKKETLTITELYDYVAQSNDQTQDAEFICKAHVVSILGENGWSYIACPVCGSKMEKQHISLRCRLCDTDNGTGVQRYCVELAVHDGTAHATFVAFDSEMEKILNKQAIAVALKEAVAEAMSDIPNCLKKLIGMNFVFHIQVMPSTYNPKHECFIVSTIAADIAD